MRVLWLSHFVPWPPHGGALQRSHHLLRQAGAAHQVHLLCLNQRAILSERTQVERALAVLGAWCSEVEVYPIPADRSRARWSWMAASGLLRRTPYDVNWLRSPGLARRAAELAHRGGFDLVHVDTLGLAPHAKAFRRIPRVLNHHNVESQMMARRAEKTGSGLRRRYLRFEARRLERYERRICPAVDLNLVVSELDGERLRQVAPAARTAVVENGVNVEYFRPSDRPEEPRHLVFAGGMDWYPNREAVRFLVREIWPRLSADGPDWRLTVVGRHPPEELLAAARSDPRVAAPGFVEDARLPIWRAGIYVCPIRDGGGTRLKILDALAMGKALVGTALSVEGIELRAGEHYLRAEEPGEFADRIRELAGDDGLRRRLGAAGRELVERRYAWPVVGRKLLGAWEDAAGSRGDAEASSPGGPVSGRVGLG